MSARAHLAWRNAAWRVVVRYVSRVALALATLAVAGLLAGCGLGAGTAPTGVNLTVSSGFGATVLLQSSAPHVSGSETVMSLLMRNATVTTRYGGGFVQSLDGHSGGQSGGDPVDWFYYVNGVLAPKGAADTVVHAGDRIWWDLHDWSQAEGVPAVVGSFPEPFLHGVEGRRLPVRVECAQVQGTACRTVAGVYRRMACPRPSPRLCLGKSPTSRACWWAPGRSSSPSRPRKASSVDRRAAASMRACQPTRHAHAA